MLTHDIEPVIDFIVNKKPTGGFVSATHLSNRNNIISEVEIDYNDMQSQMKLLINIIKDNNLNIIHRLIAMRKFIEHTGQTDEENFAYNILSSLIHGEEIPYKIVESENVPLSPAEINYGESYIKSNIPEFLYNHILNNDLAPNSLLEAYSRETCNYLKLQIFRIFLEIGNQRSSIGDNVLLKYIDETYHIENDSLYDLDHRKYEIVPDFIIQKCDEYMISQLLNT